MKSCPTCNRTFEDTFTFCLADGSLLDAPFDPQATLIIPELRKAEPPPTEVLPLEEVKVEIHPNVISPSPTRQPKSEDNLTETQRLQLEYWTAFRDFLLQSNSFLKPSKPQAQTWFPIAIGRSHFRLEAGTQRKGRKACAYLILSGPDAKPHFHLLQMDREAIENEIGESLEWSERPTREQCYVFLCKHKTDPENRQDWEVQHEWLKERLELFHRVFAPRIKNLNASEYISETEEETRPKIPLTIASPKPEQKPKELVSTITAPAPAFEPAQLATSAKLPARKSNVLAWVIIVLGSIFIIAFVFWVLTNKNRETQTLPRKVDISIPTK
jgi:hypothetical protein